MTDNLLDGGNVGLYKQKGGPGCEIRWEMPWQAPEPLNFTSDFTMELIHHPRPPVKWLFGEKFICLMAKNNYVHKESSFKG